MNFDLFPYAMPHHQQEPVVHFLVVSVPSHTIFWSEKTHFRGQNTLHFNDCARNFSACEICASFTQFDVQCFNAYARFPTITIMM